MLASDWLQVTGLVWVSIEVDKYKRSLIFLLTQPIRSENEEGFSYPFDLAVAAGQ